MDEARRKTYYDSYWNRSYSSNQRAWSTEEEHRRSRLQAGYGICAVFASIAILLSMWMLFGLYGNQKLEMGILYSRVIKVNSFFVKQIQVQNVKKSGPVAYSYSTRPELDSPVYDKLEMNDIVVDPRWQKRYTYWLNRGSYLEITTSLKDPDAGVDGLIVAIVKGEDGFQDWKDDPDNPSLALRWKRIFDKGKLRLNVEDDDDYCIVFGNLNYRKITFSFELELRYVLHSTENADFVCSSHRTNTCEFPVALGPPAYLLLTSPVFNLHGKEVWLIELSYVPRLTTYIFLWGLVAVGLLFTRAFEFRQATLHIPLSQDHAPRIFDDNSYSTQSGDEIEKAAIPSAQLCSICLDAPKDSFLDPCGHCCTCYTCGKRIQNGDTNRCPICRQTIWTVRRINDA